MTKIYIDADFSNYYQSSRSIEVGILSSLTYHKNYSQKRISVQDWIIVAIIAAASNLKKQCLTKSPCFLQHASPPVPGKSMTLSMIIKFC